MEEDYLFRGTTFKLFNPVAYIPKVEKFILAECHEEGFVFQVICISDYNAGTIAGYFKEELPALKKKDKAVSKPHFINELKRNFGEIDIKTLEIEK